jgi:hypothetical protein
VTGTGDEYAGAADAERKYGSLESNHFNVLWAIRPQPGRLLGQTAHQRAEVLASLHGQAILRPGVAVVAFGLGLRHRLDQDTPAGLGLASAALSVFDHYDFVLP